MSHDVYIAEEESGIFADRRQCDSMNGEKADCGMYRGRSRRIQLRWGALMCVSMVAWVWE